MWRGAWGELGLWLREGASPPAHPPSCRGGGSGAPCTTGFLRGDAARSGPLLSPHWGWSRRISWAFDSVLIKSAVRLRSC